MSHIPSTPELTAARQAVQAIGTWCPSLPKVSPHMASVEHKLVNFKHTTLNGAHTDFMPQVRTTLIFPSQHLVPSQLNTCKSEGKTLLHQTSDPPRI